VKQILTFSRPSQHGFRSTDLEALVFEVINLVEVSLPGSVKIKYSVSPGLRKIHADPTQLHQALMNLCTNAFHELKETGGEINLSIKTVFIGANEAGYLNLDPGNFVKITVRDNGPGIKPEIIDKIFDPFFSSKDKTEGSGLGLTVVLGIVKGHNGGVRVRSEYGQGTTFDIFLPDISPVTDKDVRQVGSEDSYDGSILFVEDDEDQLQTTPRILRSLGYLVEPSAGSRDAVEKVAAEPDRYDLVITDYDMPGMNGIDLVRKMREYAPDMPVIMISGREEAVAAAKEIAAIKYVLVKPYDKNELSAMINSVLRRDRRL
jgi:CheY-like chemotaxis protein